MNLPSELQEQYNKTGYILCVEEDDLPSSLTPLAKRLIWSSSHFINHNKKYYIFKHLIRNLRDYGLDEEIPKIQTVTEVILKK